MIVRFPFYSSKSKRDEIIHSYKYYSRQSSALFEMACESEKYFMYKAHNHISHNKP